MSRATFGIRCFAITLLIAASFRATAVDMPFTKMRGRVGEEKPQQPKEYISYVIP